MEVLLHAFLALALSPHTRPPTAHLDAADKSPTRFFCHSTCTLVTVPTEPSQLSQTPVERIARHRKGT